MRRGRGIERGGSGYKDEEEKNEDKRNEEKE